MAYLQWQKFSRTSLTPTSYSTNQTFTLWNLPAGWIVGPIILQVRTAFNGTGGRTLSVGDAGSTARFLSTTNGDLSVASTYGVAGTATGYGTNGTYLYATATAVTATFVAATGGGPTAGSFDVYMWAARVLP